MLRLRQVRGHDAHFRVDAHQGGGADRLTSPGVRAMKQKFPQAGLDGILNFTAARFFQS
jgi:hypothetical protein